MTSTPHDALVAPTGPATKPDHQNLLTPLTRLESLRLARHPACVVGTALGIAFTTVGLTDQTNQVSSDALGLPVVAATVGLGSMLAAFSITRSFDRADELVEVAPVARTTRTAAICATAIVPALVASLWLVLYYGFHPAPIAAPEWMYGTFSHADVAAVLLWGFRGASAALVLGMVVWTIGVLAVFSSGDSAPPAWTRWLRLFTPVGYFSSTTQFNTSVDSLTGSPWWYLAWLLTLCALAVVAALLWRSEGVTRHRVIRAGAVALALSVLTYGLAVTGGQSEPVRTFPDGHSVVVPK